MPDPKPQSEPAFFDQVIEGQLHWHISKLKEWDKNKTARVISEDNFNRLKDDITINGIQDELKILDDGTVLDGNNRLKALRELLESGVNNSVSGKDLNWVPVKIETAKTEADKWRIAFRGNGHFASWSPDGLNEFLPEFENDLDLSLFNIDFNEPKSISETLEGMEQEAERVKAENEAYKQRQEVNPNARNIQQITCPKCGHEFEI